MQPVVIVEICGVSGLSCAAIKPNTIDLKTVNIQSKIKL